MMDIVKLLREAGDVYHDIARDMLQNEWKEHLAPHYTQRGDELKLAADELEAQEPVAYTGSGSISAIKAGADGYIWGSSAPAHPVPLYLHPPTERAVPEITGDTSDGYHTFNELYEFRKVYNAALFNEWAAAGKYNVHKSWRHHDGEDCFGGGWFIVVAVLPAGQISNHYPAGDWELFAIPAYDKANVPFDGHTGHEVLERLRMLAAAPGAGGGE